MMSLKQSRQLNRRERRQDIYDLRRESARLEAAKSIELGRLRAQLNRVLYWLSEPDKTLVALLESITQQRNQLYSAAHQAQHELDQVEERERQLRAELTEAQATIARLEEENRRLREDVEAMHGEAVSS